MIIKVRDKVTGIVYSSNMDPENKQAILSMSFCTSYTQVEVQNLEEGQIRLQSIILPPIGTEPNWVDLIAITDDDHEGEFVIE